MLGGIGSGIAQKQAMEDQIRAQQWASNRWTTPGLSSAAINASQGSINVPMGYLQRAAQVRGLMNQGVPYGPVPAAALPGAAQAGIPGAGVPPVPGPVKV
jgi:hypothetical protein